MQIERNYLVAPAIESQPEQISTPQISTAAPGSNYKMKTVLDLATNKTTTQSTGSEAMRNTITTRSLTYIELENKLKQTTSANAQGQITDEELLFASAALALTNISSTVDLSQEFSHRIERGMMTFANSSDCIETVSFGSLVDGIIDQLVTEGLLHPDKAAQLKSALDISDFEAPTREPQFLQHQEAINQAASRLDALR